MYCNPRVLLCPTIVSFDSMRATTPVRRTWTEACFSRAGWCLTAEKDSGTNHYANVAWKLDDITRAWTIYFRELGRRPVTGCCIWIGVSGVVECLVDEMGAVNLSVSLADMRTCLCKDFSSKFGHGWRDSPQIFLQWRKVFTQVDARNSYVQEISTIKNFKCQQLDLNILKYSQRNVM